MEQVSGRAGRADGKGRVLIQAYNIHHPVLSWVKEHDVQTYYQHEIKYREQFTYPPFCRLIKVIFKHTDEQKAINAAQIFAKELHTFKDIIIQGPGPAIVSRVRNQYIHEIWIKCPKDNNILDNLKSLLKIIKQTIMANKGYNSLAILFDVDPF